MLIEGPKWCGKTTTAANNANSVLYLADTKNVNQYLNMVDVDPSIILTGETPRLIDEWQVAPKLWDAIRFEVDQRNLEGQFILTGSAVPADYSQVKHTGTGRFAWITMRPMSLFESGESNGLVSLSDIFAGKKIAAKNELNLRQIAFLVCRGGWPKSTFMKDEIALELAFDYYNAIVNQDINRVDNVSKDPKRIKLLMKSYARHQGTSVSYSLLKSDMQINDTKSLDEDTIASYIKALKKIFVIEDMPSWNPNLRSKTSIRSADTRYFIDPSIATAALGISPNDLINDLATFGVLFETMCVRDLRVYADSLKGQLYHYRDSNGLECDAVIHLRDGNYGLVEIKIGGDMAIDHAVKYSFPNPIDYTTKDHITSFG